MKERNTDSLGCVQKPTRVFIMVEAGGNMKQLRGAVKAFCASVCISRVCVCVFVCVQRSTLWLTRQTLCGLTRLAVCSSGALRAGEHI